MCLDQDVSEKVDCPTLVLWDILSFEKNLPCFLDNYQKKLLVETTGRSASASEISKTAEFWDWQPELFHELRSFIRKGFPGADKVLQFDKYNV